MPASSSRCQHGRQSGWPCVVGELQGVGLPAARGGRLPTSVEAGDLSGSPSSHPPDPASEGGRTGPARRTRDPAASCLCNPDRRAGMRGLMQWKRTSKSSILFLCFDFLSHCKSLGADDFRSSFFFTSFNFCSNYLCKILEFSHCRSLGIC
jgi:hypothetical protein